MIKENHVALYVRVSTEDQVEGHSLAAQENLLRSDAKLRGKLVYKVYQDAGISGIRENRTGLNELLHDAKRGCFGEVLVWTVSRISRKLSYLLRVVEELKTQEIAFRSLSEQFDITTPMGQFALTMMGAVAQMQRESWLESSHIGMEKRTQSGRWGGGNMLGYRMEWQDEAAEAGGTLTVVPEEALLVKEIFAFYADGLGYKAIVNRLNKAGKTGKQGRPFTSAAVRKILGNAAYIGKTRFGDTYYDGIHEPIIARDVWDVVQAIRKERTRSIPKKIRHEYLLAGLLQCPVCGSGMVPAHTKQRNKDGRERVYHYYICGAYHNQGSAACTANSVPADKVEQTVLTWLQKFLTRPFWLERVLQAIRQRYESLIRPRLEERRQAEQQLTNLSKRQGDLLRDYEDDRVDRETFTTRMIRLKAEKERWQALLTERQPDSQASVPWSVEDIRGVFRSFRQVLAQASVHTKRQLLRQLITRIQVNEKKQVAAMELTLPALAATEDAEGLSLQVAM